MNITFDPLNRDERSVVLALLGNLEAPAACGLPVSIPATLLSVPPTDEKPATTKRKKKDDAPAVSAGTAALNPAMVDTSTKLVEAAAAIAAVAPTTVAQNVPQPFVPAPLAPLKAGQVQVTEGAVPAKETPTIGALLENSTTAPVALTREDIRDLLSTYAAKGPEENKFATAQLKDCMFKLSLLQADKYPAVAAALAEKGWTLELAKAAVAATKAKG